MVIFFSIIKNVMKKEIEENLIPNKIRQPNIINRSENEQVVQNKLSPWVLFSTITWAGLAFVVIGLISIGLSSLFRSFYNNNDFWNKTNYFIISAVIIIFCLSLNCLISFKVIKKNTRLFVRIYHFYLCYKCVFNCWYFVSNCCFI